MGGLNGFLSPESAGSVQFRYNGQPVSCEIRQVDDGEVVARLAASVFGVAPGQSAVFYDGEKVVGGGVVRRNT